MDRLAEHRRKVAAEDPQAMYELLKEQLGLEFIVRFRGIVKVTSAEGEMKAAIAWTPDNGRSRLLRGARVTKEGRGLGAAEHAPLRIVVASARCQSAGRTRMSEDVPRGWRHRSAWAMISRQEATVGLDELVAQREELLRVARAHGASSVRVFGSTARGTAGPASDVDFLVEFEPGRTLLDLVALGREWGALLGRRADVTTPRALHPLLAERILAEARPL